MTQEIRYYLSIVLRRLPFAIPIVVIGALASAYYAMSLPPIYRAEALLLVEQPQIPSNLARSTVDDNAPEQLEIIEQRLLTRENLLDIANEFDVYDVAQISPDQVVDRMRSNTSFRRSFGRDRATTLRVNFEHADPRIAATVVNEYVTRVLQENVSLRTNIAEETMNFFEQEVERLSEELDIRAGRILEFKNQNLSALPESMNYRLTRQSSLSERRTQLEREKESLERQKARLQDIFAATGRVQPPESQSLSREERQLIDLRQDLEVARSIYSDQNPRVRMLVSRIEALEANLTEQPGAADAAQSATNPQEAMLNLQVGEIDTRIGVIDEELEGIADELERLEESIAKTPANSVTLEALERDLSNTRSQYDAAISRLATAATGERIELTAKGQRISVLRQATTPREPASPDRQRIFLMGLLASMAAAGGLIVALEFLNHAVRRPSDLTKGLGITPIATVPYIITDGEVMRRRGLAIGSVAVIAIGLPAALYLVHVEYLPLDLLADRAIARLGF